VRVLGLGGGYISDIADAIMWASGNTVVGVPTNAYPAKILNMSLGGVGSCPTTYSNAINAAKLRGSLVVAAAGNNNIDASLFTPANCPGVLSVAAIDNITGGRAYFSNYGASVSVAAQGMDVMILSQASAGAYIPNAYTYNYGAGTSFAAPQVSGVAALMLQSNPYLAPDALISIIKSTVKPFAAACSGCGTGIVNAYNAVYKAKRTPVAAISPASFSKTIRGSGTATFTASSVIKFPGQGAPYTYQWTGSSGVVVASPTAATTNFTMNVANCNVKTGSITLTVKDYAGTSTAPFSASVYVESIAALGKLCP
jgi:serine protease